jgi:hypothetical protein
MAAAAALAGLQLLGGAAEGEGAQRSANFQADQAEVSAQFAEMNAVDAIARGDEDAEKYQEHLRKTKGAQRAALAAQGINVDVGTASAVQKDTSRIAMEDIATIKNNAWRESFGFKQEASSLRSQANFTRIEGRTKKATSLLTSGAAGLNTFLNNS